MVPEKYPKNRKKPAKKYGFAHLQVPLLLIISVKLRKSYDDYILY